MVLWVITPRKFNTPTLRSNLKLRFFSLFKLIKLFGLTLYDKPYFFSGRLISIHPLFLSYTLLRELNVKTFIISDPNGDKLELTWSSLKDVTNVALISPILSGYDQRFNQLPGVTRISLGDYYVSNGQFLTNILIDMFDRQNLFKKGLLHEQQGFRLLNSCLYTKPREFKNLHIPSFLYSGDKAKVNLISNRLNFKETFLRRQGYFWRIMLDEIKEKKYE